MIFLDTNVLIDVLEPQDNPGAAWSRATLSARAGEEKLVSNLIVVSELAGELANSGTIGQSLGMADVELVELDLSAALAAGAAIREYRRRGGPRRAILPDFLIAGHAAALGAALMTRDRRLATYFPDLTLITPETEPHG